MLTLATTFYEETTAVYAFPVVDETGAALPDTQIATLTLTSYDHASETILNNRDAQDVKNTNNVTLVTVPGPPLVTTATWTLQPEDTVIVNAAQALELHGAIFRWTWNAGSSAGAHAIQFAIENLTGT